MRLSISTARRENLLGLALLPASMFVLPFIFDILDGLLPRPMTNTEANILYFALNFLWVTLVFRNFLRKSLKAAIKKPLRCLLWAGLGLLVYYPAVFLIARVILYIKPNFSNVNDSAIVQMSRTYTGLMFLATGILVPIYEEVLYRGLVFQGLHQKSRFLAYAVSMAVFSAIHVIGYIGFYDKLTLMLCFLQYLPAGAVLAYTYERTDTIVTPMLIHIAINQISLLAMR